MNCIITCDTCLVCIGRCMV